MKTKKMIVILIIVILVSMTAYASGQGEGEKKTIIYMGTESAMPAENIAQYNADNPNIELIRVEQDNAKFLADAMAGTAPDIFRIGSGSDIGYYTRRGLLLDLTDRLKDPDGLIDFNDIDMRGVDSWRFDGEEYAKGPWYGLPWDYNNIGMITYNKAIFADAGIALLDEDNPITYPEMFELAKRLTQKDSSGNVVTWGYDIFAGWNKFLVSDMAYAAGLSFYADKEKSKMNEDPEMRALWKFMTQFPVQDISMNVNNSVTGGTMAAFRSDRVAMTQLGYRRRS
jgi:multiple sugar transport system substrate-binding protein